MGRYPFRKKNRQKKLKKRYHPGRNKHHLVPRSRGGNNTEQNLLLLDVHKHDLWHRLWGNRTIEEILALLSRMARMKRHQHTLAA